VRQLRELGRVGVVSQKWLLLNHLEMMRWKLPDR